MAEVVFRVRLWVSDRLHELANLAAPAHCWERYATAGRVFYERRPVR
jgi:hypothetical protein